jgi:transketolase
MRGGTGSWTAILPKVFDGQETGCKSSVLPDGLPRVAVESGVADFWWKRVRAGGSVLGVDHVGELPTAGVYRNFG